MHIAIYLNSEGTEFAVEHESKPEVGANDLVDIHPIMVQVFLAKGKIQVLAALKALKDIIKKDEVTPSSFFYIGKREIKNYDNYTITSIAQKQISLSVTHRSAPYRGHQSIHGLAHRDSIEQMIGFVDGSDRVLIETSSCCSVS